MKLLSLVEAGIEALLELLVGTALPNTSQASMGLIGGILGHIGLVVACFHGCISGEELTHGESSLPLKCSEK